MDIIERKIGVQHLSFGNSQQKRDIQERNFAAFSSVIHAQQISNPFEKKEQLQPGKTAGTYVFSYSAAIEFSQEPAFPVNFTIADYAHKPVFQFPVNDNKTFTISTELAPGGYWINSRVLPDKATTYWDSSSVSLFVDQSGKATINEFPLGIRHLKKMTTLSPSNASIVSDKRPLLRWAPLTGAVSYRVQWLEENAPFKVVSRGSGETKATEFQITEDVIAERQYEWSVDSIRADEHNFKTTLIDAESSPWKHVEYIGSTLNRSEALAHPWLNEVFAITDAICEQDIPIKNYLENVQ